MSKVSFSRVDCWKQCPRKYRYRYIDNIEVPPDFSPTNPLVLGSAMDTGIQFGYEEAEKYYLSQFPMPSNARETELMKMAYWIPKLQEKFHKGAFQVRIESDRFIGFADYIEDHGKLLVDFKYSNNAEHYAESPQIHVYASELPVRPEYMAYVLIPKTFIRQKNSETIEEFRERVMGELEKMEIQLVWVDYDQEKVDRFWEDADAMWKDTTFEPIPNDNCKYCDYKDLCQTRPKRVLLPRSEL